MKLLAAIYLYFFSGLTFVLTSVAFYSTPNSNLTPAFATIGCALMIISAMMYKRRTRCQVNH
jgi:hypothetical protein